MVRSVRSQGRKWRPTDELAVLHFPGDGFAVVLVASLCDDVMEAVGVQQHGIVQWTGMYLYLCDRMARDR